MLVDKQSIPSRMGRAAYPPEADRRGFSAIEITMVATVMAILALVAVPALMQRMTDARIKATLDEMAQIAKAQQIVFAETGEYMRLQDLDNTKLIATALQPETQASIHLAVPSARWNKSSSLTTSNRTQLIRTWNGPYIVYQQGRALRYADLNADPTLRFVLEGNGGTVPEFGAGVENPEDLYPVDPWGTPYLFYGNGLNVRFQSSNETPFNLFNAFVYSLGPDGLPGDSQQFAPLNLVPGQNPLGIGTGDDLVYKVQ